MKHGMVALLAVALLITGYIFWIYEGSLRDQAINELLGLDAALSLHHSRVQIEALYDQMEGSPSLREETISVALRAQRRGSR